MKLTPDDDRRAYNQSLPTPINLKDDLTVELALLQKNGIITTIRFSKYASPSFAQRKPNGRLRFLVDLKKINNLFTEVYINHKHPVSTLSDALQHRAGQKRFCNLFCYRTNTPNGVAPKANKANKTFCQNYVSANPKKNINRI